MQIAPSPGRIVQPKLISSELCVRVRATEILGREVKIFETWIFVPAVSLTPRFSGVYPAPD